MPDHSAEFAGQRFGRLVPLAPTGESKGWDPYWSCQCDCGNVKVLRQSLVRRGITKSCGCLQREATRRMAEKNRIAPPPIGTRHFRLTVTGHVEGKGDTRIQCRCDCGAETVVRVSAWNRGLTKSCGCWASDLPSRRFWARVKILPSGCWLWMGGTDNYGYGTFVADGEPSPHRWAYHHFIAPIPEGLQIDHTCRNRTCVNPAHLECATLRENLMRGVKTNQYANRTHCSKGHEYTPENTAFQTHPNGKRTRCCRECRRGHNQRAAANISEKRKEGEPCAVCSKLVLPSEAVISRRTYGWAVCSECREGGKVSPPTEATEP